LLLAIVAARRPVEVHVVHPLTRRIALFEVMRVAIAFRRRVRVVEMGEEPEVGIAEVLAAVRTELVRESDEDRLAIACLDHRTREGSVEAIDDARGQIPRFRGLHLGLRRNDRVAERIDRQRLQAAETMFTDLQPDVVEHWFLHEGSVG
jgi:hypothetical protein